MSKVQGVPGGPGAVGGTGDSPVGHGGEAEGSSGGQRAAVGCQETLGGCPTGWGAALGCQGMFWGSSTEPEAGLGCQSMLGGCPGGWGEPPAPRAAAQPCGPAAQGGCSPRCSRRCPRCAGTAGDSGGLKGGGPWQHWAPHSCHPLLTQHLRSSGSGCPSRLQDSPGGTRHGAEWDRMAQPSSIPAGGCPVLSSLPDTVPITVASGQRGHPGNPPSAVSLPTGRRAG